VPAPEVLSYVSVHRLPFLRKGVAVERTPELSLPAVENKSFSTLSSPSCTFLALYSPKYKPTMCHYVDT
jgi:hypothetical protein